MTSSQTHTTSHTRTETATFLSEVIMGGMVDILATLGIDVTRMYADWDQDVTAIREWIEEESLETVVLECQQPGGTTAPIFEFPVSYEPGGRGDKSFVKSQALLTRYRAKLESVPAGTTYRLVCTFRAPRTPKVGWDPTTRASTDGLTASSFGTLGGAPHAGVSLRYLK